LTIVRRNEEWKKLFCLQSIKGFIDNGNNIPMIFKADMTTEDDPLLTTTVTSYLKNYIKDGEDNKIFDYVFPPINGTREVIVKKENLTAAIEFIKVCHGALARNINDEAIHKVFEDPVNEFTSITSTPWKGPDRTVHKWYRYQIQAITTTQQKDKKYQCQKE
jgi:hypothetical protein